MNKVLAVGMSPEEAQQLAPQAEQKPPNVTINYADVQPDAQVQILEKIGVQADPNITVAEKMQSHAKDKQDMEMKKESQAHSQMMAERSQALAENPPKVPVK